MSDESRQPEPDDASRPVDLSTWRWAATFDEVLEIRLQSGSWPVSTAGADADGEDLAGVVEGLLSLRAEEWPTDADHDTVPAERFDEVLDLRLHTGQWPVDLRGLDAEGADLAGVVEGLLSLTAGEWPADPAGSPGTELVAAQAFDDLLELRLRSGEWPLVLNEFDDAGELAGVVEGLLTLRPEEWPEEPGRDAEVVPLRPPAEGGRAMRLRLGLRRVAGEPNPPWRGNPRRLLGVAAAAALVVGAVSIAALATQSASPPGTAKPTVARLSLVADQIRLTPIHGPVGPAGVTAVLCTSAQDCVATATAGNRGVLASTTSGGTVWSEVAAPAPVTSLDSLSCTSASSCLAAGAAGGTGALLSTADGGATWKPVSLPTSTPPLSSISCSASSCAAVGGTGAATAIVASNNGGNSWTAQNKPPGLSGLLATGCPSDGPCVSGGSSAGTGAIASANGPGQTWSTQGVAPTPTGGPPGPVAQLFCSTSASCAAVSVGSGGLPDGFLLRNGSAWQAFSVPPSQVLGSISVSVPCIESCAQPSDLAGNVALNLIDSNAGPQFTGSVAGVVACLSPAASTCWALQPATSGYEANLLPKSNASTVTS